MVSTLPSAAEEFETMPRGSTLAATQGGGAFTRSLRDRPPGQVALYQRRRILIAATEAFAQGYDRTAVEDVVEGAGVSRRTVYDLFDGKEAIFRAAHTRALASLRRRLPGVGSARDSEPARTNVGLSALLAWATAEPTQALLVFAPTLVAGPHAPAARQRLFATLGPPLGVGAPDGGAPPLIREALLGGLAELLAARLLAGDAATLPSLAPSLTRFILAYRSAPEASTPVHAVRAPVMATGG
jgi:AcrR family transcriptional regulator